ncbi:putative signal peptide-containing protein [Cryptosporidium canis]|uniref:Signal peptide-containing protein n=1 Tax=Cryptosporidium canis TaxID=195482 RepID=A0A9D5HVT2_9CRYT|nr:putative signal peptide-containing protein [Cryptosporidium canis]
MRAAVMFFALGIIVCLGCVFSQNEDLFREISDTQSLNLTRGVNETRWNETKNDNSVEEEEEGLRINPISWDNVLKGLTEIFNEVNQMFVSLWESIRNYIKGDEGGQEGGDTNISNKTIDDRLLWSLNLPEFKIKIPLLNTTKLLFGNKPKKSKDSANLELMKINRSTSEEEMLSAILLSCAFFALYLICWIFAYVKDLSDWVSVLNRPNLVFLQQIPSNDQPFKNKNDEKINMFNGIKFPYTNSSFIPPIRMRVGYVRILTITIQTLFFPLTFIHFLTSKFKVSHFHFEYFNSKLKSYYERMRSEGSVLSYYYMTNQEHKSQSGGEISGKKFSKSVYDENIVLLNVLRFLLKKENDNKLPSTDDIKEWCDGFWFKVNKIDKAQYSELLPRLACLIILRKFVGNEMMSHDYLRRLRMQIVGANSQADHVRDWIRSSLMRNNPKLNLPDKWTQRSPAGSIRINLHENGIFTLISSYMTRVGIHSETQIKLLMDLTSGDVQNLECYLWLIDELQTVCIHPTVLCNCIKGFDSLEWIGPMGFLPFDQIMSISISDVVSGTVILALGEGKASSKLYGGISGMRGPDSSVPVLDSSFRDPAMEAERSILIKFTVLDEKDDISSLNHLIKSLIPQSKSKYSYESELSEFSTEASRSLDFSLTLSSTLPRSVLNEGTNDVFLGERLSVRARNLKGDFESDPHSTCFWDFDMPVPFTATSVLINDVLTYVWINYDSKLLCIQRKDVSIEGVGDPRSLENLKSQLSQIDYLKESLGVGRTGVTDHPVVIESLKNTPNSDSCIEILNFGSILGEHGEERFSESDQIKKANTVTRGLMSRGGSTSIEDSKQDGLELETPSTTNKWLPFDRVLHSAFGVLTSENIQNVHPVYAVPGVLGGCFCTRGFFIGSIVSIHIVSDFLEDVVDEYTIGVESQLMITLEGGVTLRINTFSHGAANSLKENLEQVINSLEENVMLPMRHSLSKLSEERELNARPSPNLKDTLFSAGVSPPDLVSRLNQLVEYEKMTFKECFIKSFARFSPLIGRLQWNSSSPRTYRWLSYTASTSLSHFLIFYLLSSIPRINKVENGILVGWIAYCILNISKVVLDSAMEFSSVLHIMSVRQQAAYSYFRLWVTWLTSSFCLLITVILSVLTILQSAKPINNIETSSGFILNDINYSISTWIAGFMVTFLSLFLQPLTLALSYSTLLMLSKRTGRFDGFVAFFRTFCDDRVKKTGQMPARPGCIIKKQCSS